MTINALSDPKFDLFDHDDRTFLTRFFVTHPSVAVKSMQERIAAVQPCHAGGRE